MSPSESTSPDGRFEIRTNAWEAFNSHWVESPSIHDTVTGEKLPGISDGNWSLDDSTWRSDTVVEFSLRKYPGNHTPSQLVVSIDCIARTATVGSGKAVPLSQLERALDAALTWR